MRNIAIIGSGQAGLLAAHGLIKAGYKVTLRRLEAGRYHWVIRCGEAPAEADGEATANPTVPLALGCGSTRISTAICAAIIAVFAPRRRRRDERAGRGISRATGCDGGRPNYCG